MRNDTAAYRTDYCNHRFPLFFSTRQDNTGMFGGILSYWTTTDTSNRSTLTAEDRKAQENATNCIKVTTLCYFIRGQPK